MSDTDEIVTELLASGPTAGQLAAIGEALYRFDAPRYGNDIRPWEELPVREQQKFAELARIAVTKWEEMRG